MTERRVPYIPEGSFRTCGVCLHFPVCRIRHNAIIAGVSLAADQPEELVEEVQMNIATHCKYYRGPEGLLNQDGSQENVTKLLSLIGDEGHCRGCGAPIFWVTHKNGKKVPYTITGLNHFIDCPKAKDFR